jgi:hypothetical protein
MPRLGVEHDNVGRLAHPGAVRLDRDRPHHAASFHQFFRNRT